MYLKENGYDSIFEKYCAVMCIQVSLAKTVAAYYSEFEPRFKSENRIGLCGLTLWQARCMEPSIRIDDLLDADTNIRIACKFLRFLLSYGVKQFSGGKVEDANYFDVLRYYGKVTEYFSDMDMIKVKHTMRYYSQKAGEPQSYEPGEMAPEIARNLAQGHKVI